MVKQFFLVFGLGVSVCMYGMEPEEQSRWSLANLWRGLGSYLSGQTDNLGRRDPGAMIPAAGITAPQASGLNSDKIKAAICAYDAAAVAECLKTIDPNGLIVEMPLSERGSSGIRMIKMSAVVFYGEYAMQQSSESAVLATLLHHRGDPNARLLDKNPILFKAAQKEEVAWAKLLLEHGGDPFICDSQGGTLLFNSKLSTAAGILVREKARERNSDKFKQISGQ